MTPGAVGGKAANLARIRAAGLRVPRSCVIPRDACAAVVAGVVGRDRAKLARALRDGDAGRFAQRFAQLTLPPALRRKIARELRWHDVVIVRSSAVAEDAAGASLAGHYESVVCARKGHGLDAAVGACLWSGVTTTFRLTRDLEAALSSMALLVQGTVQSEKAGVCFSRSPLGDERAMVVAAWGSCHGVVDGSVASDTFLVDADGCCGDADVSYQLEMTLIDPQVDARYPGDAVESQLGDLIFHGPAGPMLALARVPRHLSGEPALWDDELAEVAGAARTLERAFGRPVDVEFAFDEGDLTILQARPITARARVRSAHGEEGRVASPGKATGRACIVKSVLDIDKVRAGDVLIVVATDPGFLPAFQRAVAVVSEEGSPLSHTAIVAREMRLPCLVGIRDATRGRFLDGDVVTVDADAGRVSRS